MRKRTRRSHHALSPVRLIACTQCGQAKVQHAACGNCGHLNDRISVKVGAEES